MVNIPSVTLQRVDNFVSGKYFATAVSDLVLDWPKNWQVNSCVWMNFIFWLNTKFSRDSFADVMSMHNLTNRFQVAVHLFSNRSQMTSKCDKNKKVAHEAQRLWCLLIMRIMYQNKTRHCQHPWPSCLTLLRTEFSKSSRSVTSCENEELSETIYREFSDSQETSLREVYGRRVRSPSHLG